MDREARCPSAAQATPGPEIAHGQVPSPARRGGLAVCPPSLAPQFPHLPWEVPGPAILQGLSPSERLCSVKQTGKYPAL